MDLTNDGIGISRASAVVEDSTIERAAGNGLNGWKSNLTARRDLPLDCTSHGLSFSGDANEPPGTLTLPSVAAYWDGSYIVLGDNQIRSPSSSSDVWVHPAATIVSETPIDPGANPPPALDPSQPEPFYLPFDIGGVTYVSQGPDGWSSHDGLVAYDLNLPNGLGTPVRAVAPGRVIRVRDSYTGPGSDRPDNLVWVAHGYGIIGYYGHLDFGTLQVVAGQPVSRYDVLAAGGVSGHSTEPHLHMEFFKGVRSAVWPWPVCFQDVPPPPCGVPQLDVNYTSGNSPLPPTHFVDSVVPSNLFIGLGDPNVPGDDYTLELTDSVPLAYFHTGQRYMFRGMVPAQVKLVRLWLKDYVTQQTVATIEGFIANGRFAVGFELPDSLAGPYLLGLDGSVNLLTWDFTFPRWLTVIVVGPTGVVPMPPDEGPPYFPPDGDFDADGTLNAADPWVDVTVNSPLWDDPAPSHITLRAAVEIANYDWRPTWIHFDPAVFPPAAPVTIACGRNLDVGNDGDVIDGTGAGVILQYAGPPDWQSSALKFRGTGTTVRNVTIGPFPGHTVKVGSHSTAVLENVTLAAGAQNGLYGAWASTTQFYHGVVTGAPSIQYSACWFDEDSHALLDDVAITLGRSGIFTGRYAHLDATGVQLSNAVQYGIQLMLHAKANFDGLLLTGREDYASIWTERHVTLNVANSTIDGGLQGIYLDDAGTVNVRNTHIQNIGALDGITVDGTSAATVQHVTIDWTGRHGIALLGTGTLATCDARIVVQGTTAWLGASTISHWGQSGQGSPIYLAMGQLVGGVCTLGDYDANGFIDATDFAHLANCFAGPDAAVGLGCPVFDYELDNGVDLRDFAAFQTSFTGPP